MTSILFQHEYVLVTCGADGCDQTFGMHQRFYDETRRTGCGWTCPKGHQRVWKGKTTEQQLKDAEAREVALKDQLAAAVHEAEQTRQALLRDRQRFANGVCPCCNRSFENVRRHMTTKHPDYDATRLVQPSAVRFKCSCGRSFETLRGLRVHQGHQRGDGWEKYAQKSDYWSRYKAHLTDVGPTR
jgi:hypothetical protein